MTLAWVCDDSFISIRYADNLVHGHGFVYNAGERVEGYTNLFWTLILAAFIRVGASPVTGAEFLGVVAYAAVAFCLTAWASQRGRDAGRTFCPSLPRWCSSRTIFTSRRPEGSRRYSSPISRCRRSS